MLSCQNVKRLNFAKFYSKPKFEYFGYFLIDIFRFQFPIFHSSANWIFCYKNLFLYFLFLFSDVPNNFCILKIEFHFDFHCKGQRFGREPWSSGNWRRLTFWRSWVRIPSPYTGWTWHFSHWFVVWLYCLFEKTENKRKRGRGWPIFFKKTFGKFSLE